MKKLALFFILALLSLALLTVSVSAEEADPVKGIFDKLTAADSSYSEMKAEYAQYYEGIGFAETLGEDGFTIEISGNEDMQGSRTFTRDGDFLTVSFPATDYTGATLAFNVLRAAADYYGLNGTLVTSYISGLSALGIESPEFKTEIDASSETQTMRIYIAGPFEMKELDQMVLTDDVLNLYGYEPLDGDYTSRAFNLGKISMLMNGNRDGVTILLQEYSELDDLALSSLKTVVNYMKPAGYEAFVSEYAELKDAQGDGWNVKLNPDEETVKEIYPNPFEGYSCMVVRLGDQAAAE